MTCGVRAVLWLGILTWALAGCASDGPTSRASEAARADDRSAPDDGPRIARVWRGRVERARSDEYENYLDQHGVQRLLSIPRNRGVQMMRRDLAAEGLVEFLVISYWDSRDDIRAYAGADIEKARFMPRDREFLVEPDEFVRHYDIQGAHWSEAAPR